MTQIAASRATHQVLNQAGPANGWNAFSDDHLLVSLAERHAPWVKDRAARLGARAGDAATQELARLANRNTPELKTHDRFGNRIDWVEFHPAWHELMALAFGSEVHSLAWTAAKPGRHFARGVLSYIWNQIEQGVGCPTGMTYAAYPGLAQPEFAAWREKILSTPLRQAPAHLRPEDRRQHRLRHDREAGRLGPAPDADHRAFRRDHTGRPRYLLTGHKWFFSVPVSDGFFTLARADAGVSCFFVPGFLPDGARNAIRIQRLKDKCGNRSNASSEIEYDDALAWLVGEEGHGIREILTHAHLTRLDFAIGSAGLMRQTLTLALNHAAVAPRLRPVAGRPADDDQHPG